MRPSLERVWPSRSHILNHFPLNLVILCWKPGVHCKNVVTTNPIPPSSVCCAFSSLSSTLLNITVVHRFFKKLINQLINFSQVDHSFPSLPPSPSPLRLVPPSPQPPHFTSHPLPLPYFQKSSGLLCISAICGISSCSKTRHLLPY